MDSVALGERPRPLIFRRRNYFFISVYAFALSYFGTALGTIGTPQLIVRIVPDALQGTATGVVRYVGLLVAIIVQALAGNAICVGARVFSARKKLEGDDPAAAVTAFDGAFAGVARDLIAWTAATL